MRRSRSPHKRALAADWGTVHGDDALLAAAAATLVAPLVGVLVAWLRRRLDLPAIVADERQAAPSLGAPPDSGAHIAD